jgi:hypothetical protein
LSEIDVLPLHLKANPARVVVRPFHLAWQSQGGAPSRTRRIVDAVLEMDEISVEQQLKAILHDFETRHWHTRRVFMTRYDDIVGLLELDCTGLSEARRQLLGAYFCHEYSYCAAALMNPSVVPHPDQSGMSPDNCRILMSLRAVGEGHISSIAFREGIITHSGELYLAPEPPFATAADAHRDEDHPIDGAVTIFRHPDSTLSGTVIFPITEAQANGLEDLRLTTRRRSGSALTPPIMAERFSPN